MPKKLFKTIIALLSVLTLLLGFTKPLYAQGASSDQAFLDSLRAELDYFFDEVGVKGYLLWQYSGPQDNPTQNDRYSFFEGSPVCDVLHEKAATLPGDRFLGVNVWSLAERSSTYINQVFSYLSSSCGTSVVRMWGDPERGGAASIEKVLNIANSHNIKIIFAFGDYNGVSGSIIPFITSNPTPWYAGGYRTSGYLDHVQSFSSIGNHPALFAIELMNEPHCSGIEGCVSVYNNWAREVSSVVRGYSGKYIGIGQMASHNQTRGDSPGAGSPPDFLASNSTGNITITSGHYYTKSERDLVVQAKQLSDNLGKPFYIGEAGYATGETATGVPPGPISVEPLTYEPRLYACNDWPVGGDDFHSLRPFPASPCNPEVSGVELCGNNLTVRDTLEVSVEDASNQQACRSTGNCEFDVVTAIDVLVDLRSTDLPIVGNTEMVPNSIRSDSYIPFAQRMNEYVSWYLNGVTQRAEEQFFSVRDPETGVRMPENEIALTTLSGPIKKLLPRTSQIAERHSEILDAIGSVEDDSINIRHNQIAVCMIGGGIPFACYRQNPVVPIRLCCTQNTTTESHIPVAQPNSKLFPYTPFSSTEDRKGEFKSPLQRDLTPFDYGEGEEQVSLTIAFTPSPPLAPGARNATDYAGVLFPAAQRPLIPVQHFEDNVHFAHMEEDRELGDIIQHTYLPSDFKDDPLGTIPEGSVREFDAESAEFCEILNTRRNPGDRIFAEIDEGKGPEDELYNYVSLGVLEYWAEFNCRLSTYDADDCRLCIDNCRADRANYPDLEPHDRRIACQNDYCARRCEGGTGPTTCTRQVQATIPVETRTPLVDELWKRTVAGSMSVFRRIYPRVDPESPITIPVRMIEDIPTVAGATYLSGRLASTLDLRTTPEGNFPEPTPTTFAGDPELEKEGTEGKLFFPHLGSIHKYFLQGIQRALRPRVFSRGRY